MIAVVDEARCGGVSVEDAAAAGTGHAAGEHDGHHPTGSAIGGRATTVYVRSVPSDPKAVGDLHLATVVINVQDMQRAVGFWCAALGYRRREVDWDPEFIMLVHPEGRGLPVSLQLASAPPVEPVRLHLDLYTSEQDRQVDRLIGLGASRVFDWTYPKDADFIVLRDPDGNEFCVIDHVDL
jgi:catechol 2,3-dioxygenase-like lactoylglutathione lyase family enzyme